MHSFPRVRVTLVQELATNSSFVTMGVGGVDSFISRVQLHAFSVLTRHLQKIK